MRKMIAALALAGLMALPVMAQNDLDANGDVNQSDDTLVGSSATHTNYNIFNVSSAVAEDIELGVEITPWAEVIWSPNGWMPSSPLVLTPGVGAKYIGPDLEVGANTSVELRVFETLGTELMNATGIPEKGLYLYPAWSDQGIVWSGTGFNLFSKHLIGPNCCVCHGLHNDAARSAGHEDWTRFSENIFTESGYGRGLGGLVDITYDGIMQGMYYNEAIGPGIIHYGNADQGIIPNKTTPYTFEGRWQFGTCLEAKIEMANVVTKAGVEYDWTDIEAGSVTDFSLIALVTVKP